MRKGRKSYWGGFHADVTLRARAWVDPGMSGRPGREKRDFGERLKYVDNGCVSSRRGRDDEGRTVRHPRVARPVPSSNGTIFISTARWPASSPRSSSRPSAGNPRHRRPARHSPLAGFLVRPFGAIMFGRIGDIVGRKYTFLVTILVMGAVHLRRRPAADILPALAGRPRSFWSRFACCRASRSAASMAAQQPMWPNTRAKAIAATATELDSDHRYTRPVHGARVILLCRTTMDTKTFAGMGMASAVPRLGRAAGLLGLDPAQAE